MNEVRKVRMALMGPQRQATPATAAQARGRYFNSANAFNIRLPDVPAHSFAGEAARAMAPGTPTGFVDCDQSAALGSERPATTPLMLARYARIAAGEALAARSNASGTIGYVIRGAGHTNIGPLDAGPAAEPSGERIDWSAGDVIFFPGGAQAVHHAVGDDAVLWLVNDEPLMDFGDLGAAAVPSGQAVHYPAAEIRHQLAQLYDAEPEPTTSGRALIFRATRSSTRTTSTLS